MNQMKYIFYCFFFTKEAVESNKYNTYVLSKRCVSFNDAFIYSRLNLKYTKKTMNIGIAINKK